MGTQYQINPREIEVGIIASTTQVQGEALLTADFNVVTICANDRDVVTIPSPVGRDVLIVKNDGNFELQIFPEVSTKLARALAIDTSIPLPHGQRIAFTSFDSNTWEYTRDRKYHGSMDHVRNEAEYEMIAVNESIMYHHAAFSDTGLLGFTFDPGGAGLNYSVIAVTDAGAGDTQFETSVAHGVSVGDLISHSGFSEGTYNTTRLVQSVPSTKTYTVTQAYVATGTGTLIRGATLKAGVDTHGDYLVAFDGDAKPAGNNVLYDFHIHIDEEHQLRTEQRISFGAANDIRPIGRIRRIHIEGGERIGFMLTNRSNASNILFRNLAVVVEGL